MSTQTTVSAKAQIDRIVYLASLVSEPRNVDKSLDALRVITAKSPEPSPHDVKTLKSVQADLEDYLIHKERFRSFTAASLQANVERHFANSDPTRRAKIAALRQITLTIITAGLATGALAGLKVIQGQVVLAFFVFTLFAGLALVFRSFKKDLVAQLHGSMNYLMAGTVGTGLFALHFPIIASVSYLEHQPLLQHGGFLIGAVPVYAFYYLAFYLYAKQLNVTIPRVLRRWSVAITAVIVASIAALLPHPVAVQHEIYFDIAVVGFAVSVYLSAMAAVLGFMAMRRTTGVYRRSTMYLAVSMVFQTIGNGNFLVFVTFPSGTFPVNEEKGQILTAMIIVLALVSQYIAAYRVKTALD